MTRGVELWAKSYIVRSDGVKIYVENPVTNIEEQMKSNSPKIVCDIAAWIREETIAIMKEDVKFYGKID